MGSLFSSSKKEKKEQKQKNQQQTYSQNQKKELSQGERARVQLQHQRDKLREKRRHIEKTQDNLEKQIKALIAENKREKAKAICQQKMLFDKFLDNIIDKETFVMKAIQSVDMAISDKEMADIIHQSNQVLRDIQDSIDYEKLQDNVMEIQEMRKQQDHMTDLFKQYNADNEDDIDKIYNQYEQDEASKAYKNTDMQNQQFVPLPQQTYQQNKQQHSEEDQQRLEMLE